MAARAARAAQAVVAVRRRVERPRQAAGREQVAAEEVGPEQRQVSVAQRRLAPPLEGPAEEQALRPALTALRRLRGLRPTGR